MKLFAKNHHHKIVFLVVLLAVQTSIAFAQSSITLNVDATEASKNILHVKETLTVKAGAFTLYYPKWIPGEHSPTGPINNMVNLFITADGKPIEWQRDDIEMFAFHINVPTGAKQIEIAFDDVSESETTMSAHLARIKWNRLLLYPKGAKSDNVQVTASMKMPTDWKYATALPVTNETANTVDFKQVSLTYFVDSPAVIGKYFKRVPLVTVVVPHEIDIFADTAKDLEYKTETLEGWNNLVTEANLLFGAHHYKSYKFLLTLSDVGGSEGLEHHESSEDGVGEKALSEPNALLDLGDLLGHEYAHSWNGKYRRPIGLATGDYETPMKGELLWVYEGLTEYLGRVLPTRSKLWTPEFFREVIASDAAELDNQTGRRWRPLVDTARDVQFTYDSPRMWRNERRRVDYYDEGALIWLDADVLIRQKSDGKLSLDDFMKKFHGGQDTEPMVEPYDLAEIVRTLNTVVPYNWQEFFNERVYKVQNHAPLGGITNGGWKLVYNDKPNLYMESNNFLRGTLDLSYSIGIILNNQGLITDINPDSLAAKAGLAPGMTITNVTKDANKETSTFEVENGGFKETYTVNYAGKIIYPHLVRDESKPDLLSGVIKPLNNQGFIITTAPGRGKSNRPVNTNKPADITNVLLSQTEVTANCLTNSSVCSDSKRAVEVSSEAIDPEKDALTYYYIVTAGKVIGTDAKVIWDLTGVKSGTYTITAAVDDGCGFCGKVMTKTVVVKDCPDCKP